MKLSLDWISDFVNLKDVSNTELLKILNTSICEVESLEEYKPYLATVLIGEIKELSAHPKADKLQIVQLDLDQKKLQQIVTGAKNIAVGDRVPVVMPGTSLPSKKIESTVMREVQSDGMLASEKELELGDGDEGIWILPKDSKVGISLQEYFQLKDFILEIDNKSITNRPDLWSHFGFAREFSAHFRKKIHWHPLESNFSFQESFPNSFQVLKTEHAHSYHACEIQNVKVSESIPKIRHRLQKCGIKVINNIVDVSNYVMLECGQPTHFFDSKKLPSKQISVELTSAEETVTLLDKTELKVEKGSYSILSGKSTVVLAGVIGTLDSGVQPETTSLLLESATFKRELIRESIKKYGIRTDACSRYEKGLDASTNLPIIHRILQVLKENGNQDLKYSNVIGFSNSIETTKTIQTKFSYLKSRIGKDLPNSEMEEVLQRLYFQTKSKGDSLEVTVPFFRKNYDVTIPDDLVEEIGRSVGYSSIERTPILFPVKTPEMNTLRNLERSWKTILSQKHSFSEVFNYSFSSEKNVAYSGTKNSALKIQNQMPEEHTHLRTSLLPGIVHSIRVNLDRQNIVSIFELGRIYFRSTGKELGTEERIFSFAKSVNENLEKEFLEFKNIISSLFPLQKRNRLEFSILKDVRFYDNACLAITFEKQNIGILGLIHPKLLDDLDCKTDVVYCELKIQTVSEILKNAKQEYSFSAPSEFPQAEIDISILMDKDADSSEFLKKIDYSKIPEHKHSYLFDVFSGSHLGENQQSVTFRFYLEPTLKTFSADRLKEISDYLIAEAKRLQFSIR